MRTTHRQTRELCVKSVLIGCVCTCDVMMRCAVDLSTLSVMHERFSEYVADRERGVMSRAGFESLMRGFGVDDDAVVGSLYRVWDANADGHIDFVEFVHYLNAIVHGTTSERLHRYFKIFDLDGNGWSRLCPSFFLSVAWFGGACLSLLRCLRCVAQA
jgi:hypothetical protein